MPLPNVYPGKSLCPYNKPLSPAGSSFKQNAKFTSVTALVRVHNQPNIYMLTTGHSFRDMDENRQEKSTAPGTWNIVGEPSANRARNQEEIAWNERLGGRFVTTDNPLGISLGQYHCAGDKLGSVYDAGLIQFRSIPNPASGTNYDNIYRKIDGDTTSLAVTITNLPGAADWPPSNPLPPGEVYFADVEQQLTATNPFRQNFASSFVNWDFKVGKSTSPLEKIILCEVQGTQITKGGMSGMPLLRYNPNHPNQATLVGIYLGRAADMDVESGRPEADWKIYEVYQHISMAVNGLGITSLAP